jgi:hypothetical protein
MHGNIPGNYSQKFFQYSTIVKLLIQKDKSSGRFLVLGT